MQILIIKLSALGDIVHSLPALNLIHKYLAAAKIDFLVEQNFATILEGQESIREIIPCNKKELHKIVAILQKKKYDLVIDMQGLIKTAILARLCGPVLGFAKPREAIAALFYNQKVDCGPWLDDSQHVIEKNIELVSELIQDANRESSFFKNLDYGALGNINLKNCIDSRGPQEIKQICFIPCTTWESKHWPQDYWLKLGLELHKRYNATIHILGTPKDQTLLQSLAARLSEIVDSTDQIQLQLNLSLKQLPSFFASMDLIVGVDTGPIHIAAAAVDPSHTQIIGIYGPSSAARSGPFGFSAVSAEELFGHKPRNKRKLEQDSSITMIQVANVLDKIEEGYTGL